MVLDWALFAHWCCIMLLKHHCIFSFHSNMPECCAVSSGSVLWGLRGCVRQRIWKRTWAQKKPLHNCHALWLCVCVVRRLWTNDIYIYINPNQHWFLRTLQLISLAESLSKPCWTFSNNSLTNCSRLLIKTVDTTSWTLFAIFPCLRWYIQSAGLEQWSNLLDNPTANHRLAEGFTAGLTRKLGSSCGVGELVKELSVALALQYCFLQLEITTLCASFDLETFATPRKRWMLNV